MFIIRPPGIVYEGETDEEAAEIDRKVKAHNDAFQKELDAWRPGKPAKFYEKWCRKYAPHLLTTDQTEQESICTCPGKPVARERGPVTFFVCDECGGRK